MGLMGRDNQCSCHSWHYMVDVALNDIITISLLNKYHDLHNSVEEVRQSTRYVFVQECRSQKLSDDEIVILARKHLKIDDFYGVARILFGTMAPSVACIVADKIVTDTWGENEP